MVVSRQGLGSPTTLAATPALRVQPLPASACGKKCGLLGRAHAHLAVVAPCACGADEKEVRLVEAASGVLVAAYRPLQRVWVELSADGSRAHGPAMRMRLLADSHPSVLEAVRQGKAAEAEAAESAAAGPAEQQGCGALPRGHPSGPRRPYRPPGLHLGEAGGSKAPPPSFQRPPQAPAGVGAGAAAAAEDHPPDEAGAAAAAAPAAAEGEPRQGLLHIAAPRTAVCEAGGAVGGADPSAAEEVAAAVRQLRARASRYALRAAEGDPAGARAKAWEGKAAACRAQLAQLERLLAASCPE